MTNTEVCERVDYLNSKVDFWSLELQKFPVGVVGLVPEEVRQSEEFQRVGLEYRKWFSELREFNSSLSKAEKRMLVKRSRQMKEGK